MSPTTPDRTGLGGLIFGTSPTKRKSPAKKVTFDTSATRAGKTLGSMRRGLVSSNWNGSPSRPTTPRFGLHNGDATNLTPSLRRSRRAQNDLARLQSPTPNGSKRPAWTPDQVEILSDNIRVLFESLETTPEMRQSQAIADGAATKSAQNAMATPARGNRKRPREASTGQVTDDEEEPDAAGQTHKNQQPLKRLKMSNIVQVQAPVNLAKLAPQPLRIDYKAHPLEDRSDQWFIEMFRRLFRMCGKFTSYYFGVHDLDVGAFHEPWSVKMAPEFIIWAEQVAEEDPSMDGWDGLLRNTEQRQWFVMAILMRILRVKVFDVDLWGANKQQKELLLGLERAFLDREGFQRTELRSSIVRAIIGRRPLTQNFYSDIALLTAQVSLLFKPLSDYLYGMPPQVADRKLPSIEDQYQSLHNIISTAAYLSLCIRLSPTIFTFNETSLGEAYDPEDHWNLEMEYYTESKQKVVDIFNKAREEWNTKRENAVEEVQNLGDAGKEESRAGKRAAQNLIDIMAQQPRPPGQTHRPMTKISVWPNIIRYKPGSDEDDNKALLDKDGFRIYQISKSAIVCYYGERDAEKKQRLTEFIVEKQKRFDGQEKGLWGAATLVAVVAAGWVWRQELLKRTGIDLGEKAAAFVEMASNVR